MKKLIAIILTLALSLSIVITANAEIDLSAMSNEELIDLMANIKEEMATRLNLFDDQYKIMPPGSYYSDKDIAVGTYEISPTGKEVTCSLYIWSEEEDRWIAWNDRDAKSGDFVQINVPENSYIIISSECYIRPATKIEF